MITGRSPGKASLPPAIRAAIYGTVHDFGAEHLAQLTGQSQGVIDNKANPNATTLHIPTVPDVMSWQQVTKDFRILHAMAQALGHVSIPLPDFNRVSDEALLELLTKVGVEGGEFHSALREALLDRKFSVQEFERIEGEAHQWMAAIAETLSRVRGYVDE
jgi:hypothetical protein